jgi:carbonic anhydrase
LSDIDRLLNGFGRFREKYFEGTDKPYNHLKFAQQPNVLVIACSDSRVDPAILFDADPGDLFVVRNVANLVPPYSDHSGSLGVSAALEFAVCELEVNHIVVLGHSHCGGIQALAGGAKGDFIPRWMKIAEEASTDTTAEGSAASPTSGERTLEQSSIRLSLKHLMTFPFVKERVEDAKLTTHGWYFDLGSGGLFGYDPGARVFALLNPIQ